MIVVYKILCYKDTYIKNLSIFLAPCMKTLVLVTNDLKHFDPCVLLRILSISIYVHLFPRSHLSSQTQS
jgi:hypothetical protein